MLRYFVARRWRVGKVIWQSITPKYFWWVTCGRLRQILACRQWPQVRYHRILSQIAKRWIESPKVPNRIQSQIAAMKIESLMVKSNPMRRFNSDLNRIVIGICPSLSATQVGRTEVVLNTPKKVTNISNNYRKESSYGTPTWSMSSLWMKYLLNKQWLGSTDEIPIEEHTQTIECTWW